MLFASLLVLVPAAVGCSDGGGGKPDAFVVVADAKADAPPPPPGCDFFELRDATNDAFETTGSPEESGVTFATGTPSVLCGKTNIDHYEPPQSADDIGVVDVDSFKFTLTADSTVYITMYGSGLEALEGNFRIWDGAALDKLYAVAEMFSGHTSMRVGLAAGTYRFDGVFLKDTAPTAEASYKIRVVTEAADTRCIPLTTGGYAEVETGTNTANDVLTYDYEAAADVPFIALTTGADAAENTAITAAAGMSYHLTGNSANNTNVAPDDYKDKDTFKFTTGPTTTEVTIRSKFATTTADIDTLLAVEPAAGDTDVNVLDISNRLAAGPSEEILTAAVKPNTNYWLWVGGYKTRPPGEVASTASPYEATICGTAFVGP